MLSRVLKFFMGRGKKVNTDAQLAEDITKLANDITLVIWDFINLMNRIKESVSFPEVRVPSDPKPPEPTINFPKEEDKSPSGHFPTKTSDRGYSFLKYLEGCKLKAYQDGGGVWTIGFGHTGPDVYAGLAVDSHAAGRLLVSDANRAAKCITDNVRVPLLQHEFDALVSFTYNVGVGAFSRSTLLKRLNGGDRYAAANELLKYNKDNGMIVGGLVNRRYKERGLFLSGQY